MWIRSIVALAALVPSLSSAYCFTVLDARSQIVYQSTESPIDLSLPIGEATRQRFGAGATTVMSGDTANCPAIAPPGIGGSSGRAGDTASRLAVLSRSSVFANAEQAPSALPDTSTGGNGRAAPGTDFFVNPYTRANGSRVQGYTRAAPSRR